VISRAAALAVAALAAEGTAGRAALANDLQSCKVRVQHGAATLELRQARDTATEVTGHVRPICRAELSVTAPGREPEVHAWRDIHAAGDRGRFGVAILPGRVAGLVRVAKYGDADGRLVLVARDGRTMDVPGPEHVVDGRFIVTVGERGKLAVVDTVSFTDTMRVEGDPKVAAGREESLVARGRVERIVRQGPDLLVVLGGPAPEVLRLDRTSGRLVRQDGAGKAPEGANLLRPPEWADCSCQQPAAPP
jgi:hypothetical protein